MAARCASHGTVLIGGVCQACDGQPQTMAYEIAQALALLRGPQNRRDNARANQYGGKGVIKFNPSESETRSGIRSNITLVDWQSEDGMPTDVTIDIGRIASSGGGSFPAGKDAAGNSLSYRANAQVIIGTPSAMSDPFLIDIARGQRFTCSASYVAVTAQMLAPAPGYISGSMAVIGELGIGPAPSLAPVVITQYIDALGAGLTSAQLVIPVRANFLLPVRSSDLVNLMTIQWLDNAGAVDDQLQFANGQMVSPAPCANAYAVQVINGGTITASYRLVYQVSV